MKALPRFSDAVSVAPQLTSISLALATVHQPISAAWCGVWGHCSRRPGLEAGGGSVRGGKGTTARRILAAAYLLTVLMAIAGPALAATLPVPVEGQLLVTGATEAGEGYSYVMAGDSDTLIPTSYWHLGEISPLATHVAYTVEEGAWPDGPQSVWFARTDGSEPFNITAAAGLDGINCTPRWSPDGSRVAFQHADLVPGVLPCDVGFEAWLTNIDGTDAHRLMPEGSPPTYSPVWSPNGHRLACEIEGVGTVTVDVDGANVVVLPNVGSHARWSPDGSRIVSVDRVRTEVGGEPGELRRLLATDAEGGDLSVLVEHFLADSVAQAHLDHLGPRDPADYDWLGDIAWWVGPLCPQWAPHGDRIAFVATMPLDPLGPEYKLQTELWMYDVSTSDLTRLTYDNDEVGWLSWNGPNTSPEDPTVTVDQTTVTLPEVSGEGLTTILLDGDPPSLPDGCQPAGPCYDIATTAPHAGLIAVEMGYREAWVPTGVDEASLMLLEWDGGQWLDITVPPVDTVGNLIHGECTDLGRFRIAAPVHSLALDGPLAVPNPAFSGALVGVSMEWTDSLGHSAPSWHWDDGGAGGTFSPSPEVQNPTYLVPVNGTGSDLVVTLTVTASCAEPPAVSVSASVDLTLAYDFDSDGMADAWELTNGLDPTMSEDAQEDPDSDGAANAQEFAAGTDPYERDTDGDGFGDGEELSLGSDPRDSDEIPTAGHFPDVEPTGYGAAGTDPYWAFHHIEAAYRAGIVAGYPDGSYGPAVPVCRDQMAVYISRALAGGDAGIPTGPEEASFTDVGLDHWAYRYIEYAVAAGIVEGYLDGSYLPAKDVDRGQMAAFVARAMAGGDEGVTDFTGTPTFEDVTADSGWAWVLKYVEYIQDADVVQGYPDGLYHPETVVTRDQMAVYVVRAFNLPM